MQSPPHNVSTDLGEIPRRPLRGLGVTELFDEHRENIAEEYGLASDQIGEEIDVGVHEFVGPAQPRNVKYLMDESEARSPDLWGAGFKCVDVVNQVLGLDLVCDLARVWRHLPPAVIVKDPFQCIVTLLVAHRMLLQRSYNGLFHFFHLSSRFI